MSLLKKIKILMPFLEKDFEDKFVQFLLKFGELKGDELIFKQTDDQLYPLIAFQFAQVSIPKAIFETDNVTEVEIINETELAKLSPHKYTPIQLDDFVDRMSGLTVTNMDHVGFNLPWFDGVHPDILQLRKKFADNALYYLWPTDESWDFILPGSEQEIGANSDINLTSLRYPKFEIVSFEKASKPLIQFEFQVKQRFEHFIQLFPEGISNSDPNVRNVWIYIDNDSGIDICFVVNEDTGQEWSNYLNGHRLVDQESKF